MMICVLRNEVEQCIRHSMAATHGHLSYGHTYRLRAKLYNKTVFARSAVKESEEEGII